MIIVINDNNKGEDWVKRDYILNKRKVAKKIIDNNAPVQFLSEIDGLIAELYGLTLDDLDIILKVSK